MSVFCGTCGFLEPCKCIVVRCKAGEGVGERIVQLERDNRRLQQDASETALHLHDAREANGALHKKLTAALTALLEHRIDLHQRSNRPCATCSQSADVLGLTLDRCPQSHLAEETGYYALHETDQPARPQVGAEKDGEG